MPLAIIDLAVRALVLLAAAWLAVVALRRTPASLRALIWTSALASLLVLPALRWTLPAWDVPMLPAFDTATPIATSGFSTSGVRVASETVDVVEVSPGPRGASRSEDVGPAAYPLDARSAFRASDIIFFTWASIALLLLMRLGASHWRLARLARSGVAPHPGWLTTIEQTRASLRLRRTVDVRVSDAVGIPAVWGMFRPVLLLPPDANTWTSEVRRLVALHELAHVSRWDALGQLFAQLACAWYWCVPLTWLAARRAAVLRECASDDVVLRAGVRPSSYAVGLVQIARAARGTTPQPALLAMARRSGIRERVVWILNPVASRRALGIPSIAVVVMAMSTAVVTLAAATPATENIIPPDLVAIAVTSDHGLAAGAQSAKAGLAAVAPSAKVDLQTTQRFCAGALDRSSSSINDNDGDRRWTVKLSGKDCSVDLQARGRIEFTDDFTDIKSVGPSGSFRLDVTERGVRRQLEIETRNGSLARVWRVDGREQPYDAAARAWFAAFLIELDRRTAIGVDVRLPHLLRQGGVDAVLDETAMMASDYGRSRYYTALSAATKLSTAEVARVLKQGASLSKSDYYAAELLKAYSKPGLQDPATRAAVIELIDRMESDHYRSESVSLFVGSGQPSAQETEFLLRMVPKIASDHYKLQTLSRALTGTTLTRAQTDALIAGGKSISSDFYRASYLKALLDAGALDGADAVLALIAGMESDHYQGESLAELLRTRGIAERDLLAVVTTARTLGDHYAAQALRAVARHSAATEKVRAAVLAAADGLSRHYAEEVRRSVR